MNHSKLGFYKKKMYIFLSLEHEDMPKRKTLNPRKEFGYLSKGTVALKIR